MGAEQFTAMVVAKDAFEAFDKARKEATYLYGHAGYTGTIAEKDGFKLAGQVDTWHWDKLHEYFTREVHRLEDQTRNRPLPGKTAPDKLLPTIRKLAELYDDKWGPAICFQITGTMALEAKRQAGRIESHDKVFIFVGWASS